MPNSTNAFDITFTLNGVEVNATVPVRMHAADFLRQELGKTGTHIGCEQGVCGMCTVVVDDLPVKSCLLLAVQLDRRRVRTVEGLGEGGALDTLQAAFRTHHALQCGYCTPGFLMLAQGMAGRRMDAAAIREEINGVLCRCTGYEGIIRAIEDWLPTTYENKSEDVVS